MVPRTFRRTVAAGAALVWSCIVPLVAPAAQVTFDLPDTIECRDATPKDFAAGHPDLKVIEARLRISARFIEGSETEIVDFLYIISSPDKRMRIQDYLPNTTLESTVADDRIEVAASNENSEASTAEAHVAYKVLALGGSKNQSTKKSESNHYKQIVPQALVLSSGTTDREHGVFYKLRPSNAASLEGAKEFTFLATVPKAWRGDWCTVSCAARTRRKSFFQTSIVTGGVQQTQVGIYLVGDREAASLAEELRQVQDAHAMALKRQLANDGDNLLETMYAAVTPHRPIPGYPTNLCGIFKGKKGNPASASNSSDPLDQAEHCVVCVQERLRRLAE